MISFKYPVDLEITRSSDVCPTQWDKDSRIRYIIYLIDKYNYLVMYNYKIYEAVLSRKLIYKMKQNFKITRIEDSPPSYDELFH